MRRLLTLFLLLAPLPAAAHPHVWIEATLGIELQGGKVTALDVTWVFDDLYSELVRVDFDQDGDGRLSQQELDALVGLSAANLSQYSFFTHLLVGGEARPVLRVEEFYADLLETGLVRYRFRIALPEPVDPRSTSFAVGLYDESYYVNVTLAPKDASLHPEGTCRLTPRQDLVEPLYFGSFFPTYLLLECSGG